MKKALNKPPNSSVFFQFVAQSGTQKNPLTGHGSTWSEQFCNVAPEGRIIEPVPGADNRGAFSGTVPPPPQSGAGPSPE